MGLKNLFGMSPMVNDPDRCICPGICCLPPPKLTMEFIEATCPPEMLGGHASRLLGHKFDLWPTDLNCRRDTNQAIYLSVAPLSTCNPDIGSTLYGFGPHVVLHDDVEYDFGWMFVSASCVVGNQGEDVDGNPRTGWNVTVETFSTGSNGVDDPYGCELFGGYDYRTYFSNNPDWKTDSVQNLYYLNGGCNEDGSVNLTGNLFGNTFNRFALWLPFGFFNDSCIRFKITGG